MKTMVSIVSCLILVIAGISHAGNISVEMPRHCRSDADPMGGVGGGPIQGTLTVTVVEAGTANPLPGAMVMAGTSPGSPFANNVGITGSDGVVVFSDSALQGPTTVTAGIAGSFLFTIIDVNAAEIVIPLDTGTASGETFQVGDTITGIDVDNGAAHYGDGYIDIAFIMPAPALDSLTSMDMGTSFADMETVTIMGQTMTLPSNIYIPQQWELFMEITKDHYHVNLPPGDHTLTAVACRIALSDLMELANGTGDFMTILTHVQWRRIDALDLTVTGDTTDADFHMDTLLEETATIDFTGVPAHSSVIGISLEDMDDLNGMGRLALMGVTGSACTDGPCDGVLDLPTAETTGLFDGTGYFPGVALMSDDSNDLSIVLVRESHSRNYTENVSDFYGFIDMDYDGNAFAWSDPGAGTSAPPVDLFTLTLADGETGDTLWTVLTAGDRTGVTLPDLPATAPVHLYTDRHYSWNLAAMGLGFGGVTFDYNHFSMTDMTAHLSHTALDSLEIKYGSLCDTLGCTVVMPAAHFRPGDPCWCTVTICNPTSDTYSDIPVFMLLDVYGAYYFAPSFSEFDHYTRTIAPGVSGIEVLPPFDWPTGAGTAEGIAWYAAMTDPEMTTLFGEMDQFIFGWEE